MNIFGRNLFKRYPNQSFILDKYESKTVATFNMANMGALLDDTEASERLRRYDNICFYDRIKYKKMSFRF